MKKPTALVFAYHNIGVIGIKSLLAAGVDIRLIITHQDIPEENIWFDSVAELADAHGITFITPDDPNQTDVIQQLQAVNAQWLFSFYYRHMLKPEILSLAPCGAYNLHGSLLPKYRGRAPVNWAVLHGESTTGVSLHQMVEKPDAGDLIDQQAIQILPNDTAHDVFLKLTPAAQILLDRSLPKLLQGQIKPTPLDLSQGSYFTGRKPGDGRINWKQSAWDIHNLIRAVAPPYPGAFFTYQGRKLYLLGSTYQGEAGSKSCGELQQRAAVYWEQDQLYADCVDGKRFCITKMIVNGKNMDQHEFKKVFSGKQFNP